MNPKRTLFGGAIDGADEKRFCCRRRWLTSSQFVHIADHSRRYLDQIGDLIGEAEEFYLGGFLVYVSSYVSMI